MLPKPFIYYSLRFLARHVHHFDARTGIQCTNRIHIARGERPCCEDHLSRHRNGCKTRAIINQFQGNRFPKGMGDAP